MIARKTLALGMVASILIQLCILLVLYDTQIKTRNKPKQKHLSFTTSVNLTDTRFPVHSNTYSKLGTIRLYSALVSNKSDDSIWDTLVIQGWTNSYHDDESFVCCVKHQSGLVASYSVAVFQPWLGHKTVKIVAVQFRCDLNNNTSHLPVKVAVIHSSRHCHVNVTDFINTEFTYKPRPGQIAVFAKVLYRKLNHNDLIAWIEMNRAMGADKMVAHVTSDLNDKASRVLNYYKQLGFAELYHYSVPGPVDVMLGDSSQCWNFKGVSVFDGYERLSGYKYIVSIDPDEYVVPGRDGDWHKTFDRLMKRYPHSAGFLFKTLLFMKSWEPQQESDFSIERYLNRSHPTNDRVKHVTLPHRLEPGGMRTHNFHPVAGYHRYVAHPKDVAVYHYRSCREVWDKEAEQINCYGMVRTPDPIVLKHFLLLKHRVLEIKDNLNV